LIDESGTYVFTGQNDCSEFTETIEVTVFDFDPQPLPLTQELCPGRDTVAIGFNSNDYVYEWAFGSTDSLLMVSSQGIFEVLVTAFSGQCSQVFSFEVTDTPYTPAEIFESPQFDICLEGETTVSFPLQYAPYTLQDGNEIFNVYEATESEMLLFSYSDGCYTYNDSIFLTVESCLCPMYVPNVFTPNEDGLNDSFRPEVDCPIYDYRLIIFNRWGREIFVSDSLEIPWRGESPNEDYYAHDGVYVYLIVYFQDVDGLRYPNELTGTVTLLR
jgi:gliding motility-associated-like protein